MYNGMPGSPITYLTSAISANQTTIAIGDDTALPEAPNLCTIGYGEHIETIRYGEKSNGVLQDVTRGIEGDPRAWPIGTEVARFFTAYDHNAIIETITSHKAESATEYITIEEPFDQSADTTVNLGYKPDLVEVYANVRQTRYVSTGFISDNGNGVMFSIGTSTTDTQAGTRTVYFYDNTTNFISGGGKLTDTGFKIMWNVQGKISGGGIRRFLIVVHKHK